MKYPASRSSRVLAGILHSVLIIALSFATVTELRAQWQQTSGPPGVDARMIASDGTTLYSATGGGLYRRRSGEQKWSLIGFAHESVTTVWAHGSLIFAAILDTTPSTYYAHDLYRSVDGGDSWTVVQSMFRSSVHGYWAFGAQVDPLTGGESLYASASLVDLNGVNVARSTDSGVTWLSEAQNGLSSLWIRSFITIGDTLFAATNDGLYTKLPGAVRWSRVTSVARTSAETSLAFDGSTLFVGTSDGIYRSSDRVNFALSPGVVGVIHLAVSGAKLYADDSFAYYVSPDHGVQWSSMNQLGFGASHLGLVGTADGLYIASNKRIFRLDTTTIKAVTDDDGIINSDASRLTRIGGRLYASTLTGLFRTTDAGDHWQQFTTSARPGMVNEIAETPNSIVVGGTGLFRTTNDGATWDTLRGGIDDFTNVTALAASGSKIYVGSDVATESALHISSDDGQTWVRADSIVSGIVYAIYAQSPLVIVLTSEGNYRSIDDGTSWTRQLPPDYFGKYNISLAGSGNTIIANADGVFLSNDAGLTWDYAASELPERDAITAVSVNGAIGLAGTTAGVFISHDTGTTWHTAAANLETPIAAVASDSGYIYAGTLGSAVWRQPLTTARVATVLRSNSQSLQLYPNPALSHSQVRFSLAEPSRVTIEIDDLVGRRVDGSDVGLLGTGMHSVPITCTRLPTGAFIVRLRVTRSNGTTSALQAILTHLN